MTLPFSLVVNAGAPVAQVIFDFSFFSFFVYLIYSFTVFQKITKSGQSILFVDSFLKMVELAVSMKLLRNKFPDAPFAIPAQYAELLAGRQIPVVIQNIINATPTLPRLQFITISVLGIELTIDSTSIAENWAKAVFTRTSLQQAFQFQKAWENPNYYTGALTPLSLLGDNNEVLLVNTNVENKATTASGGTPINQQLFNIVTSANFTPTTTTVAPDGVTDATEIEISVPEAFNATPQLIMVALMLGIKVTGFKVALTQISQNHKNAQFALNTPGYASLCNDFAGKMPNPDVVDPTELEGVSQTPKSERQKPNLKGTDLSFKITKVRKSEASKVGRVDVQLLGVKTQKGTDLSDVEKAKVNLLLGLAFVNLEKVSNTLQVNSNTLIGRLLDAWKNAQEKVDPDLGKS